jgi:ABC-type multidrug transport system fused ATPase/permease subunit
MTTAVATPVSPVLPVADGRQVGRYARSLLSRHQRAAWLAIGLQVLAALAALAGPRLLGDLVGAVQQGTTLAHVDTVVALLAVFLVAQTVLTRYARFVSFALGEKMLAELREDFVENALALPVGVVESAGSGDLLTRTSRDVRVSRSPLPADSTTPTGRASVFSTKSSRSSASTFSPVTKDR